jgi:hypothetical protein
MRMGGVKDAKKHMKMKWMRYMGVSGERIIKNEN